MANVNNINNISKDKFKFVNKKDFSHDTRLETKPVGYFQDAFNRFCKNKGAVVGGIVVLILVLLAIVAPWFTPYDPSYRDGVFYACRPKNNLFKNVDFWDGCMDKEVNFITYNADRALMLETGDPVIKNGKYTLTDSGMYKYRYDTYYGKGFGKYYMLIDMQTYKDIQEYQKKTGRQILYPVVKESDRPNTTSLTIKNDPNIYYKTEIITVERAKRAKPVLDENGNPVLNYWAYKESEGKPALAAEYESIRIEDQEGRGAEIDGEKAKYVYGILKDGGVSVRAYRYEYYRYEHAKLNDGIDEPYFIFGSTGVESGGKDIFSCLFSGARFSFLFAIVVAAVNLFVGAIWGSVSGYFGGKVDLIMERISDVLNAVPTMIVITLLKLHMGTSSHALVLFIAFFLTGWIGMAATTRMQFYRYKNQEYVLAARTLGARDARIMFKHIFPNAIGTLVTSCALVIPSMIYSETNLSYLGIISLSSGKITSVGTMLAIGQSDLFGSNAPYVALFPMAFLILLMLSFNLFGNGLRDAFNPSLRGSEG